jgi:hypothetical protein
VGRWRNLRPKESQAYLSARGIPVAQHPAVLSFTHGQAFFDLLYLHRNNPIMRASTDWGDARHGPRGAGHPTDREAALAMVHRHDGEASARIAEHWWRTAARVSPSTIRSRAPPLASITRREPRLSSAQVTGISVRPIEPPPSTGRGTGRRGGRGATVTIPGDR